MASSDDEVSSTKLAEERTDWAEDRTLLANERTFAGWVRTGLTAVGIGVGFHALFGRLEPLYLARSIASVFVALGIFVFVLSARNANRVCARLKAHATRPLEGTWVNLIATLCVIASLMLLAGMWLVTLP